MQNSRNELQVIEVEKVKVNFLDYAKKVLFKEIEQGRITREEYIILISSHESTVINLNLDHSINANGGTWGGRIVMGDSHHERW
jgi:hypothetical protein